MVRFAGLAQTWVFALFMTGSLGRNIPTQECPIFGPTFPANFNPAETDAFKKASSTFPKQIEALFSSGKLNKTHSAFAVDVFSTVTNNTVYSYYHGGSALKGALTKGEVNDGTMYRIGSVSKLFTIYAILAKAGINILSEPLTKYLPELSGSTKKDTIQWDDVTVGALASHQAGSGGFPIEYIFCYVTGNCTEQGFLSYMRNDRRPVIPPFQTPLYSDGGYGVLGRLLERITGLPYNDALQTTLAVPLGLNSTMSIKPSNDSLNAVVLPGSVGESSWGFDNQVTAPSGGVYSNCADLRTTGLSILHSKFLSPASTRSWMKPRGSVSTLTQSVGAPWEIYHLMIPVSPGSNRTRLSDLYTKAGGNAGYSALFGLSPDHGLGFSILVAGPHALDERWPLRDAVGETFITAGEHAAMENAAKNLVGTFVNEEADLNITLTVDADHPGLGMKGPLIPGNVTVRLYPTGAETFSCNNSGLLSFRAVTQRLPVGPRAEVEGGKGMFDNGCESWLSVGFSGSDDEYLLDVVDGRVKSLQAAESDKIMTRV